jgi:hypothetical protein
MAADRRPRSSARQARRSGGVPVAVGITVYPGLTAPEWAPSADSTGPLAIGLSRSACGRRDDRWTDAVATGVLPSPAVSSRSTTSPAHLAGSLAVASGVRSGPLGLDAATATPTTAFLVELTGVSLVDRRLWRPDSWLLPQHRRPREPGADPGATSLGHPVRRAAGSPA